MSPTDTRRRIAHIVTKVFGLSGLRPGQRAVIDAVLAGTHTLAIMPTVAGKSLCCQVPAMLMPGTTVVVSPLMVELVRGLDGAAIIYAATVKHVEQIHALLRQEGVAAVSYHGRMRASDRAVAQVAFMNGGVRLIVATNAFGMGIDRPDIRTVIHYDLPASLDVYSQESGRAGREGLPARCILLFQRVDRGLQTFFMAGRYPIAADFTSLIDGLRPLSDGGNLSFDEIRSATPAISTGKIRVMLTVLKQAGLIRERGGPRFEVTPRLSVESVESVVVAYERRQRDQTKLEQMVVYAQTALCRTAALLDAFGETGVDRCDRCDNCRGTTICAEAVAQGAAQQSCQGRSDRYGATSGRHHAK